ncbi:hypothetical protein HOF78_00285 [Candidatus Woesearchaeota archaeon]|nr:hypothetical protein [Candidatus Woesearchaeota archaeon]MBT6044596.1 hypothetical protein [Candidatus Woesearchaeota archaeon]
MIVKLFGALDVYVSLLLILANFGVQGPIAMVAVVLLLIKSLVFFGGLLSFLDIFGGLMLLFMLLAGVSVYPLVLWLFVLWFLQKGLFSFLN